MTTLNEQLADDLAVFYDTELGFAESAAYYPRGGSPKTVPVIVDSGKGDDYKGADAFGVSAALRIRVSDVTAPEADDEVRIEGETWKVLYADLSADSLEWIVTIDRLNG
jgi:hypothetical protein